LGRADEVVVSSLSFVATTNAAVCLQMQPVLADVDQIIGNVTAETIRLRFRLVW
jgi:perosamine synthetase